ncbi:MAG: FAD-binding oxidoreductase [Planctomycetota bacterium]
MLDRASVAVVGGGIIGTSVAYHLAKRGAKDVVLLEKEPLLGSHATAKAAGGIRQQFGSEVNCRLSIESVRQFERFEKEMDCSAEFHQRGYLWLATKPEEVEVFRRNIALQQPLGIPVRLLTAKEALAIAPYLRIDDVVGASFCPTDGYASPADFLTGYEKQAKRLGVRFHHPCTVSRIRAREGRIEALETDQGDVVTDTVVLAAGPFSPRVAQTASVDLPIQPYRRQIFVTKPFAEIMEEMPMTVDFTSGVYMHKESGGVLMGLADKDEPPSFNETVDWGFLERVIELAMHRVPSLERAEILRGWAGLYDTTPDHHPILGRAPDLPGLLLACGFSGHGFMHAPAVGLVTAEIALGGKPSIDVSCLSLSRFREGKLVHESHVI